MKRTATFVCVVLAGAGLCVASRAWGEATSCDMPDSEAVETCPSSTSPGCNAYCVSEAPLCPDNIPAAVPAELCEPEDGDECPEWVWTAGVEATYLQPSTHDGSSPVPGALFAGDFVDLNKFDAAPRVWLGFENCQGRGVRARYWQYQNADSFDAAIFNVVNSNVVTTTAYSRLDAYTIDLEVTVRGELKCWDVLGSFGVRNGSFSRNVSVAQFDSNADVFGSTHNEVQFNGTGLTASLEGRRTLGSQDWSLIANVRGSALWGNVNQVGSSTLSTPLVTDLENTNIGDDETLWIFESQLGLEWSHDLTCCHGRVFARALFEYQHWDVNKTDFITFQSNSGFDVAGGSLSSRVDFYGPTFAVGFSR